jgi:hypothetical protein
MQVPIEIRKNVGFIGYRDRAGEPEPVGTVFFVSRDLGVARKVANYIVTAQHVIDKIRREGGRACIRLDVKGGAAQWFDIDVETFRSHPNHPTFEAVDVAVAPGPFSKQHDYLLIPPPMLLTEEDLKRFRVGPGDEIFFVGLFWNHFGTERNIPLVRAGNIAAMPEERVKTSIGDIDAYLIEARSIGGLSGCPVFLHLGYWRHIDGMIRESQSPYGSFHLMGVMHGHYDDDQMLDGLAMTDNDGPDAKKRGRVNMGIGIVTPISKVLDILETPEMKQHEDALRERVRRMEDAKLPTPDALEGSEPDFTKDDFEQALKKVAKKLPDSGSARTSDDQ